VLAVEGFVFVGERQLAEWRCRQVALGGGEMPDSLVRPFLVVVAAEVVEQCLQLLESVGGSLVVQPFLERAVESLELAQRLRVRGRGASGPPIAVEPSRVRSSHQRLSAGVG
jgi:hypothetical protein